MQYLPGVQACGGQIHQAGAPVGLQHWLHQPPEGALLALHMPPHAKLKPDSELAPLACQPAPLLVSCSSTALRGPIQQPHNKPQSACNILARLVGSQHGLRCGARSWPSQQAMAWGSPGRPLACLWHA